jgi:hypothetical protein
MLITSTIVEGNDFRNNLAFSIFVFGMLIFDIYERRS